MGVLCGAYGLFGGSEELIGAKILLTAINEIYKATPGLPSDVSFHCVGTRKGNCG